MTSEAFVPPHDLAPLYEQAEREGLWFFCSYQQLWFSPAELRQQQANGKFRWGAVNWRLRDPRERLKQLDAEALKVAAERDRTIARIRGDTP